MTIIFFNRNIFKTITIWTPKHIFYGNSLVPFQRFAENTGITDPVKSALACLTMLLIVLNLFESPSFFNNLFVTSPLCLCLYGNEIVKFHFDLGTQSPLHLINGWQWYLLMHLGVFLINYSYIGNIYQNLSSFFFGHFAGTWAALLWRKSH